MGQKRIFLNVILDHLGMLKQVFLAHFEPLLTEFSPFDHIYAPRCTLCTHLRALWWSHVELGRGV